MKSFFASLSQADEENAQPWQTRRLGTCQSVFPYLANVVAVLEQHYLPTDRWSYRINDGSVTFRRKGQARPIVRVFVDDDDRLANHLNVPVRGESIVVGIDLTDHVPFERYAIRKELRDRFRYYLDPEAGAPKVALKPDYGHYHELIFLPPGPCDMEADSQRVEQIIIELEERLVKRSTETKSIG